MCNDCKYKDKISKKPVILVLVIGSIVILGSTLCCQRQQLLMLLAPGYFSANYTKEYIRENKGKVIVEIPEVYDNYEQKDFEIINGEMTEQMVNSG
ncbi:MAG: hypothetical protein V3W45_07145 [Sedimentisphaerales bacterium]